MPGELRPPGRGGPLRLLVVADPRSASSAEIVPAAVRAARGRSDVELIGLVDSASTAPGVAWPPRTLAARVAQRLSNPGGPRAEVDRRPLLPSLRPLALSARVPLLAPRERGMNDPALVDRVRTELRPDATLVVMVPQIFRAPLLAACGRTVNYHDGLLPRFRGVGSTAWSVYEGESETGFTFHLMSEVVDAGPLLVQGATAVGDRAPVDLEPIKARMAAARVDEVLDRVVSHDAGTPQRGDASTYTRADTAAIQAVGDPSRLTWRERQRRLLAFEAIELDLGGRTWAVTALRRVVGPARRPELRFETADGVSAEPTRVSHLPVQLAFRAVSDPIDATRSR